MRRFNKALAVSQAVQGNPNPSSAAGFRPKFPTRATPVSTMPTKKDKRSGDPEEGNLTTGEKSAITRAVHEGREIHFTEEHPEKKAAAERYADEVKSREAEGGASPKSPKSPRGKKK